MRPSVVRSVPRAKVFKLGSVILITLRSPVSPHRDVDVPEAADVDDDDEDDDNEGEVGDDDDDTEDEIGEVVTDESNWPTPTPPICTPPIGVPLPLFPIIFCPTVPELLPLPARTGFP